MTEPKTAAGKALQNKVARVLWEHQVQDIGPWWSADERSRPHSRRAANAAIAVLGITWDEAALRAAGEWALVPRRPTREMIKAGWIDGEDVDPDDIYCAMLDAAPKPEDEA